MPEPSQTVTIAYKASYLSSGEIIEETAKSRPLGFTLGSDSLPMFQEAVEGMAVGGTRRVMLPPSSKYSSLEEDTVQFDLELVAVKTAPEAALFKVQQAVGNNRNLFRFAFFRYLPPRHPEPAGRRASWRGRPVEWRRLPRGTRVGCRRRAARSRRSRRGQPVGSEHA